MTRAADVIAERLYRAGVRHAFGIPGGEVLTLIDALERAGIRVFLARHENAAGFMAEGAWHATGAPGVLVATVGPGLANCVNVVANAQQDRVPLIVISGAIPEAEALRYSHQVFDHRAVLRPLVKAGFEARPGACDVMIDKAVRIALDPQPGPVHVDLPVPVAASDHPAAAEAGRAPLSPAAPAPGRDLAAARAMLAGAERPLIVAGRDILDEPGAVDALRHVMRRLGIPVLTTYKAKGVIPEDDPLCLLGHGLSPRSDALVKPLLAASDCVICAGYDPIEMRAGWQDPWDPARCIELAAVPDNQYLHQARLMWACGIGAGLMALTEGLEPRRLWPGDAPATTRAALDAAFAPGPDWGPAQAIALLDRMKPADLVTTVDSGAHRILLSQMWRCGAPRTLLQSTGLCTMGCALPMAIGFALASGRRTLAVTGDGGLEMVLGELATLRDLGLPVTVCVLNDASLALIEMKQRREGLANAAVDTGRSDHAAVARALGLAAHRATGAAELAAALAAAFAHDGPSLIDVVLPRRAYDGLI
ncbi:MAG: acetolactate synthase [Paracoccaceae bacterium]|nr:MAG: acetolactate synthase [Paracoccaceae bacterium]